MVNSHPTIKNVTSSEEKVKRVSCSEHVAAGTSSSEVEAGTAEISLKTSISANNFDTKMNNSIRAGDKCSKQKTADKDEAQFLYSSKTQGKQKQYSNSNLKYSNKDKTSTVASFAPVSAVRSMNSPIHQKPHPIPSRSVSAIDPTYPLPLCTPPPPAISLVPHVNKVNDSVSPNSITFNHKEIKTKDNHQERTQLFSKNEDALDSNEEELSCQIGLLSSKATSGREITTGQCTSNEDTTSSLNQHRQNLSQSINCRSVDIPLNSGIDIIKDNGDNNKFPKDTKASEYVGKPILEKTNEISVPLSDSYEIPSKDEPSSGGLHGNNIDIISKFSISARSSQVQSSSNLDITTVTNTNDENKTVLSETPHDDSVNLMEEVSEKPL